MKEVWVLVVVMIFLDKRWPVGGGWSVTCVSWLCAMVAQNEFGDG